MPEYDDEHEEDEDERRERHLAILKNHVSQLGEHFSSVQIFVTRVNSDRSTDSCSWGDGNWYARYGHVVDWVHKQQAETTRDVMRRQDGD